MQVLQRGIPKSELTYYGRCSSCGTTLRANHNELKHESCQREGDWHEANCPICEARVFFAVEIPTISHGGMR